VEHLAGAPLLHAKNDVNIDKDYDVLYNKTMWLKIANSTLNAKIEKYDTYSSFVQYAFVLVFAHSRGR